uniref:AC_N domain-containing protein n=1 Tax=Parastrongyloides trichosuri TaxID=131310 RepID=A0A0N4ZQZ1_PARTI
MDTINKNIEKVRQNFKNRKKSKEEMSKRSAYSGDSYNIYPNSLTSTIDKPSLEKKCKTSTSGIKTHNSINLKLLKKKKFHKDSKFFIADWRIFEYICSLNVIFGVLSAVITFTVCWFLTLPTIFELILLSVFFLFIGILPYLALMVNKFNTGLIIFFSGILSSGSISLIICLFTLLTADDKFLINTIHIYLPVFCIFAFLIFEYILVSELSFRETKFDVIYDKLWTSEEDAKKKMRENRCYYIESDTSDYTTNMK